MNKTPHNNKGFALLLSLIISSIALSIGLSMLNITLKQLTLGTTTKGSEIAFQAARAGMECLRFTRNDQTNDFLSGAISLKCLTASAMNINETATADPDIYRYGWEIDWNPSGGDNLCINSDLYFVDASAGEIAYTFPNGIKTCDAGDVCTFGFVRGYNRSCAEKGTSIFTVQRELTIEF